MEFVYLPDVSLQSALRWLAELVLFRAARGAARATELLPGRAKAAAAQPDAEGVLDRYGNAVLRLAYAYLHNLSDAEDILQDTIVKYIQSAPRFASPGHEKAWLLTVAANLSKNKLDYLRIRQTDELDETLAAQEREDLRFVWEAVKQLPEQERTAIHLFYQEGCSTGEISRILKRKESTVRSDLKRARERLKAILKEDYDFDEGVQ